MIAALAALLLAIQVPTSGPPPPAGDATSAPGPSAAASADPAEDDAASLETLRQVYQTSCADRDFYTFNDVCEQLRLQVHAAEVAADRAAREAARKKKIKSPPPT